jgi:hypothetical protein
MPVKADTEEETRTEHLGVLVTPTVMDELKRIGKDTDRSNSHVGYALILRGIEAYHKDGQLGSIRNLPFKKSKPRPRDKPESP